MEYFIVNTAVAGKLKDEFFNWAIENRLYRNHTDEPSLKETYKSGMKAIYEKNRISKDITAVIGLVDGNPVAMLICINDFEKREIELEKYGKRKPVKMFSNVEAIYLGNIMCYIKPEYREQGLGSKMIKMLEKEKAKVLIANKEKEITLMCFKTREKATKLIKYASEYSYAVYDNFQNHFNIFGSMLYNKKYEQIIYENTELYKKEPTIEDIENNKIKTISIKKLVNKQNDKNKEIKVRV